MRAYSRWSMVVLGLALSASVASAADGVAAGKIKGIDAAKKEFVLTDTAGKDWTIKLGDDLIINRGGKEVKSDLEAGDRVNVCYDKSVFSRTARYVLVQEGEMKDSILVHGSVKSYDADKKQLTLTDQDMKDWTFPVSKSEIKLNGAKRAIEDVKIGDRALAIVDNADEAKSLKCVMIERK